MGKVEKRRREIHIQDTERAFPWLPQWVPNPGIHHQVWHGGPLTPLPMTSGSIFSAIPQESRTQQSASRAL